MQTAIFFYTLAIMTLCVLTAAGALSAYFVSRKNTFLCSVTMFLCYFLELAFIFLSEYVGQNVAFAIDQYYAIDYPGVKILLSAGALESLWLIACDALAVRDRKLLAAPAAAYVFACLVIVAALPHDALRQYLFYTARQVFLLWVIGFSIYRFRTVKSTAEKSRMERHRWLFALTVALWACIVAEDAFIILVIDPAGDLASTLWPLYLSERNFSENLLVIVWAAYSLRSSADMLRLRAAEPPDAEVPDFDRYMDELLPVFCERNGLTAREREILAHVLRGEDNQQIAGEMMLALGTVKTHVHNILKKTGNATRQELMQDFWRE